MPLNRQFDPIIESSAQQYNLDPNLLRALIVGESSGNPQAVSPQGAAGLMQLMPGNAQGIDPTNPSQAIPRGAEILSNALTKGEQLRAAGRDVNPVTYALQTYFGGPEGPQWGPKTAAYPGYIASKYQALVSPQQSSAEQDQSPIPPWMPRNSRGEPYSPSLQTMTPQEKANQAASYAYIKAHPTDWAKPVDATGIDQLAAAGQPPAAPNSGMSDDDLLAGFVNGTLPFMSKPGAAPVAPSGAASPAAAASPVLGPEQIIGMLNTAGQAKGGIAAIPGLISGLETMLKSGAQFVRQPDGSIGVANIQGAPGAAQTMAGAEAAGHGTDLQSELLKQGKTIGRLPDGSIGIVAAPGAQNANNALAAGTEAGKNLQTIDQSGTVANMPGALSSVQQSAQAKAEGEQVPVRTTQAVAPREQRGAGTSIMLPPGSPAAQAFIDAKNAGRTLPAGVNISDSGAVEVGNTNTPPETVNERYKELHALQDEALQSRQGLYEAQQLQQKLDAIGTSGPMTDYLGKLSAIAQQVGVDPQTIAAAKLPPGATVQEANKLSTDLLGAILHQQFPQRITNTDITAWKDTVPRATTLQEANDFLINKIVIPKFQRSIDRYGFAAGLSANDPQLTTYYKALNDWDNQHPFDAYQIASSFKPTPAATSAAGTPDRSAVEAEMRKRGFLQ